MKQKKYFTIVCLFIMAISFKCYSQTPFGVNLAGAEFGTNIPGVFNTDYTYPNSDELIYYKSKGFNLVRLPIRWERIQPELNGIIDSNELSRLQDFLQKAEKENIQVIIDLHNYCRYKLNGTYEIIGSNNLSKAHSKDLWTKLSQELKSTPNIWGYGIMNEPHDLLANAPWFDIAQEIINGIRLSDTQTKIIVGGDSWSSAERWMQYSDNLKNLVDNSNNLIFEAHVYFDDDASGRYNDNYDTEGAYPNIGIDRVTPFVNWLQTNNLNGFVGEYGIPADDNRWNIVLDNFLNHLKQNCINGTYWAGGPWWGDNQLSVEPNNDVDKPQMSILEKYVNTDASCKTLGTIEDKLPLNLFKFYPNPFDSYIIVNELKEGELVTIYDIQGRKVVSRRIENSKISNLESLSSGTYVVKHGTIVIGKVVK